MIVTAFATFALLFPLIMIFMQGPSVAAELAFGTLLAISGIYMTRSMKELRRALPYLGCLFVYIAFAYYWKDLENDLSAKYTVGLICYLIPTGLLFREFVDRGNGNGVLLGVAFFSLCLALAGVEVLRTVGVENLVKSIGLNLSRANVGNESYVYLRYFTIENVIIGMGNFGICALTGVVILSLDVPIFPKVVSLVGFAVALYINIQVITRGAVVNAALGILGVLPLVVVSIGPRKLFRYSAVGIAAVGCLVGYVLFVNGALMDKARTLVERISVAGDDTRLMHWHEALGIIQRNPLGGARIFMQTNKWAHNFFLDTALTAGLPGCAALLLCLGLAFLHIGRVLVQGRRTLHPVFLVLLAQFLAVFLLTMTSTPSLPLFGFLLLVAGFFARPYNRDAQGTQ